MSTTIDETATDDIEEIDEIGGTEGEAEGAEQADGFALEQPYAVPSDSAFQGRDFIIDPDDLTRIKKDLVFECAPLFNHLQAASIEMAWKRKGGMANGGVQGHGHKRSDAHAVAHGAKEFLLWVAADIAREAPLTKTDVEAAVYHEMCHLGWNENTGEVKIVDEPVKYFPSEKRRYGLSDPLAEDDGDDAPILDALAAMDDMGDEAEEEGEEGDEGDVEQIEELQNLAQHLDEHPEQIDPLLAAAGDGAGLVVETAKRARGRRAAGTAARGAVGIAG